MIAFILNRSPRDDDEVRAIVEFAHDAVGIGRERVAVRFVSRRNGRVGGWAFDSERHGRRQWTQGVRYGTTLYAVHDDYRDYGRLRVCGHSKQMRAWWRLGGGNRAYTEVELLHERGETRVGRWPIYHVDTWQEHLVHLAAHELAHILAYARARQGSSEVWCEEVAARALEAWRRAQEEPVAAGPDGPEGTPFQGGVRISPDDLTNATGNGMIASAGNPDDPQEDPMTETAKWTKTEDGYAYGDNIAVTDNGAGFGPAKGSGRWAVTVNGTWLANIDTLAAAKEYALAPEQTTSVKLAICGPNLRDQSKGQFHVHTADCGDLKHYGNGRTAKHGGEAPWEITVETLEDVVFAVYPPDEFDYDPETEFDGYLMDFHFAPCVPKLPVRRERSTNEQAQEIEAGTSAAIQAGRAVHRFPTTEDAYDASQTHDEIKDGDILVTDEGIVAILVKAWPTAISDGRDGFGQFHAIVGGDTREAWEIFEGGAYVEAFDEASKLTVDAPGIETAAGRRARSEARQAARYGEPGTFTLTAKTNGALKNGVWHVRRDDETGTVTTFCGLVLDEDTSNGISAHIVPDVDERAVAHGNPQRPVCTKCIAIRAHKFDNSNATTEEVNMAAEAASASNEAKPDFKVKDGAAAGQRKPARSTSKPAARKPASRSSKPAARKPAARTATTAPQENPVDLVKALTAEVRKAVTGVKVEPGPGGVRTYFRIKIGDKVATLGFARAGDRKAAVQVGSEARAPLTSADVPKVATKMARRAEQLRTAK